MDLNILSDITRTIDIISPVDAKPTGLKLTICSEENPAVKKTKRKIDNEKISLIGEDVTAELSERMSIDYLCSFVKGWEWDGDADFSGVKLEFTADNVRKVLSVGWIRRQLDLEAASIKGFFQA